MNGMKIIVGLRGMVSGYALVLMCSGVASAGAPAPPPTTTGPHRPPHQVVNLGDLRFENGAVVKDFKVSYVTHGTLNASKDNVVLLMHHFIGDHHSFDFLIGAGKPLDPDKYFIVATDFLGNGKLRDDLTTGPTNSGLKMDFPRYTLRDSVNVEYKLLKEHLGFDHILAVIGISVGAMKAYQFGTSYPTYARGIVPIMGTPVSNPETRAVLENWMEMIELDSGWYGGKYDTNPTRGVDVAFGSLFTRLNTNRWFVTNVKTADDYRAWRNRRNVFLRNSPFDARDYYYGLQAWAAFSVGDTQGFGGDARAALASIKSQALIVGAKDDPLFNREEAIFAKAAIPKATYVEIDSALGHSACCGLDPEATRVMSREIAGFLSKLR